VQEVETRRKRRWEVFIAAIIEKTLFVSPLFEILMEFGWQMRSVSHSIYALLSSVLMCDIMRNWVINNDRKWVNAEDKPGIEADAGWYSGQGEHQHHLRREEDRLHFDFKKNCKVTEHRGDYTVHRTDLPNWLTHESCRITKNGTKGHNHHKKPINHLTNDNCKITRNYAAGDGYFQRPVDHLAPDKCKITKANDVDLAQ